MAHSTFAAAGPPPGMTGGGGGSNSGGGGGGGAAGSALLPGTTAELRAGFHSLLSALASCNNGVSDTYVMDLFFTLVRVDAVLKAQERQLFVNTAQQIITRQLQQLQRVHKARQHLADNERFIGELAERCAALECLCSVRGAAATPEDDADVSGQSSPTLRSDGDADGSGRANDGGASGGRRRGRASPLSTSASGAGNAWGTQRFSFDDNMDDVAMRVATEQRHRHVSDSSPNSARSTAAATASDVGPRHRHLQRPPPLPLNLMDGGAAAPTRPPQQDSGVRSSSRRRRTGQPHSTTTAEAATAPDAGKSKTEAEEDLRVPVGSGSFAAATGVDVTPAVYNGVQHALQEHFRVKVRHTLTGGAQTASGSVGDLASDLQQQQQQQSALELFPSISPGPARHLLSSSFVAGLAPPNASMFSVATAASASGNISMGIDAGGPLGITLGGVGGGGGPSIACSPTTQEPVDTAAVWDRMFWRLLDGVTATGDLAVLLTLLSEAPSAPRQRSGAAAAAAGAPHGTTANARGGGAKSSATSSAAAAAVAAAAATTTMDAAAAAASLKSLAASPRAPECGTQPLMDALRRTGSYSQLLPALNTSFMVNGSFATSAAAAAAAASPASRQERCVLDDDPDLQSAQHSRTRRAMVSPDMQGLTGSVRATGGAYAHAVPLFFEDLVMEEEARLHRDFWTHIPAILATLAEGVMYGDTSSGHPTTLPTSAAAAAAAATAATTGAVDGEAEVAPADRDDDKDVLAVLHPPSAEALQLLRVFSPHLRNYAASVGTLLRTAPEYARSTQVRHAQTIAVVNAAAAAQQQQQQQHSLSPASIEAAGPGGEGQLDGEHSSSTASTGARAGPLRPITSCSSAADVQELKDSYAAPAGGDRRSGGSAAGGAPSANSPAPAEALEPGLLVAGSRTDVRAVDVVVYALVTAIYVQCTTAIEMQRQVRASVTGRATAVPVMDGDARVSAPDGAQTPVVRRSPRGAGPWAGTLSGASFAADDATTTAAATAHHGSSSADEDRALDVSVANGSLSYAGVGGSGWWWNGSLSGGAGGSYSLNTSFGLPATTLVHPHLQPLRPVPTRPIGSGEALGYANSGSFNNSRSHHLLHKAQQQQQQQQQQQAGAQQQQQQQQQQQSPHPQWHPPQQMPANASLDTTFSPTELALSLLQIAHARKSSGCAGDRSDDDYGSGDAPAAPSRRPSQGPQPRCPSLLRMQLSTQDIVASANDFSWVLLPSIMKAELLHLQEQVRHTGGAIQRVEGQVRGELALLLFRVLSIVLDWLMPAVYVADQRVWLLYRKWCCDLYRVLCTDAALLETFQRLLNQSGVTASTAAEVGGAPPRRRAASARDTSAAGRAAARSATSTPTLRPQRPTGQQPAGATARTPPLAQSALCSTPPAVPTATGATVGRHGSDGAEHAVRQETSVFAGGAARHPGTSSASPRAGDGSDDGDNDSSGSSSSGAAAAAAAAASRSASACMEDAFSCILPGCGLAVSVAHEAPPVHAGLLSMRQRDETTASDAAPLRAALALLSGDDAVVPLPRPLLLTRLVAATLRGVDADTAESLLWVVGGATTTTTDDNDDGQGAVAAAAGGGDGNSGGSNSADSSGAQRSHFASPAAGGGHAGRGPPAHGRRLSHPTHRTASGHTPAAPHHHGSFRRRGPHQRSISADTRGSAASPVWSSYAAFSGGGDRGDDGDGGDSDSDEAGGYGDDWYGRLERRRRGRQPPAPAQSPVAARTSPSSSAAAASLHFPHAASRTSVTDPASASGSPHLSLPPPPPPPALEGPSLVHHHRFRYPSVRGHADVARLYLGTLEEAELVLSSHDPIYASLVLSAADLHLHDLHDTATAASLVNAYLADVGEEHIQGPVWEALPTVAVGDGSGSGSGGGGGGVGGGGGGVASPSSARPAPSKGFSVTRVRQGNTQGPTSTAAAAAAAAAAVVADTTASGTASPAPPPPQQPCVPMVVASWNSEREKDEFLATLRLLRQMQSFLSTSPSRPLPPPSPLPTTLAGMSS